MRLLTNIWLLGIVFRRNATTQISSTRKTMRANDAVGGMFRKQTVSFGPCLCMHGGNDKIHMDII